jgi:hypothetical protein
MVLVVRREVLKGREGRYDVVLVRCTLARQMLC